MFLSRPRWPRLQIRRFYHAGASAKPSALICRLPWQPGRLAMCNGSPLTPLIPADWSTHTHTHTHTHTYIWHKHTVSCWIQWKVTEVRVQPHRRGSGAERWSQRHNWSWKYFRSSIWSLLLIMRGKGCFHSVIQRQSVSRHVLTSCFCSQPANMFHSVIQSKIQRFIQQNEFLTVGKHCAFVRNYF